MLKAHNTYYATLFLREWKVKGENNPPPRGNSDSFGRCPFFSFCFYPRGFSPGLFLLPSFLFLLFKDPPRGFHLFELCNVLLALFRVAETG